MCRLIRRLKNGRNAVFLLVLFGLPAIVLADILVLEPSTLTITENRFDLFGGCSEELKIVFISDIHAGLQREGYLDGIVSEVNALEPDIVLIGGDVIDADLSELEMLGPLGGLDAKYGTYSVLGNHDYGEWGCPTDPSASNKVEERLERLGIAVLRNENEIIDVGGHRFALIGLDDAWVCRQDYAAASAGTGDDVAKVVLAHNHLAVDAADVKGNSVILSGHTHCGHIDVPFITQAILEANGFGDFMGGRGRLDDDTELYITCGVAESGPRFRTHPEISVIHLE